MEKLNYFTGEFSKPGLENYFDFLNEEKLEYELENFINQYLNLSEEEQLKYTETVLYLCSNFLEKIDKTIQKKILETINKILSTKILSTKIQIYSWADISYYLDTLYLYLFEIERYEEYSKLFENDSYFFKILDLILKENLEEGEFFSSELLSVFVQLFRQNSLPEERRIYFQRKYESFINFLFENNCFEDTLYWYFQSDERVSLFQFEHLKLINNYFMENPQSGDVDDYLYFVSRHFDDIIKDSIEVIRKIAEENDSDIIRNQAIKLIEKYDNDYLNEKSDPESISSLDAEQLLEQADKIIYYIRSKLTVDATELKEIGSFGHYTRIDTLTNYLIKADWKNENNSEIQPPFLRLTNLKQLNDPMEGRVIYDYLGIDNTFFKQYQTSNVFISSLTTVSDSLPMWKEYADSSQGAFLEYDLSYLEDIVAHKSIEFVKVHYLDLMSENKDETDVGKYLDDLKHLFEKLQDLKAEKELISFAEKLKKISYLFKVKDYEYEMEYRILINLDDTAIQNIIKRDANDSSNEKYFKKEEIGLEVFDKVNYNDFRKYIVLSPKDNGRYDLFVYINLLPLKYSKVILGPKVTDADYIAPYLKLANPEIEIESSKIPYRGA
ncbi:DUF2971 domain-containing protein [Streptococcus sp. SK140]|uniref:DUF2971 domain-containing protein n=1 Tax=Streptococcus sp. SK140 TaxID=1095726 RepID=UPI00025B15EA|nr:DUF2971 domain-containing protein [Streptococcus sp. SK140]EIF38528.1 PF11185 family protein [Streptococcus sp. SK140]